MYPPLLLFLLPLVHSFGEQLALITDTSSNKEYCAATRPGIWGRKGLDPEGATFNVFSCSVPPYKTAHTAVYIDYTCNITQLLNNPAFKDQILLVSAPFSEGVQQLLNSSTLPLALQVDGTIQDESEVTVEPLKLSRVYWGAVILYFYSLVYVSIGAVVVDNGEQVVARHAKRTPLDNIKCLQNSCFQSKYFSILAVAALAVLCMAVFIGYLIHPIMFQPLFATMLALVATVGFYHLVFPVYVILAVKYIRVVNKSTWLLERTAVTGLGLVIFLLWTGYRNVTNMWPFQVFLFTCVGVVMLRYSPMNSIRAITVPTIMLITVMALNTFILPMLKGTAPKFIDIVTVQAYLPATLPPGPIFTMPALEPQMLGLRVPLFGLESVCSRNIDSTVGVPSFIVPAIFIKAALAMDKRVEMKTFRNSFYIISVVMFLACHISVFALSYVMQAPVNGTFIYLPGIWLAVVLTALRTGTIAQVLHPPTAEETLVRDVSAEEGMTDNRNGVDQNGIHLDEMSNGNGYRAAEHHSGRLDSPGI